MHIAANVVHADLDRPDIALDTVEQLDHLLFAPRIDAERVRNAARCRNFINQRLQLITVAPRHAGNKPFTREPLGNGASRCITSPNYQRNFRRHSIPYRMTQAFNTRVTGGSLRQLTNAVANLDLPVRPFARPHDGQIRHLPL